MVAGDFLKEHVSILAMNEEEADALTGESDPLLASDKALDWVDLVLCTAGPVGLYMAGFTEEDEQAQNPAPAAAGGDCRVQPVRVQPRHAP